VFDENVHIPFATVSDMWSRTLSIYSSGKTFSATGWKIGWVIGPADLVCLLLLYIITPASSLC
jgi:aspartate/methionine/tyrosine aminotransferase